jgi:tetratricopeptide (TPR) repeat protein
MATIDAKICPHCGTRNKPQWEFCAGCGESMVDVTVVSATDAHALSTMVAGATAADAGVTDDVSSGPPANIPWGAVLMLPLLVAVAVVVFKVYQPAPPLTPSPALFSQNMADKKVAAAADADRAPRFNPKLGKARSLLYKGDTPGALALLGEVVAEDDGDADAHYTYAQALWDTGEKDKAVREYEAAVAHSGGSAFLLDYARALAGTARYDAAVSKYETLLNQSPDSILYLRELSTVYVQKGAAEKAVPLLKRAVAAAQGDYMRVDLAVSLDQAKAYPEAEKLYREIITDNPASVAARAQLAELLYRGDRGDEAIQVLNDGITQTPNVPGMRRQLAFLLEKAGRSPEAAKQYREYVRLAPRAQDAREVSERAAQLEGASPTASS